MSVLRCGARLRAITSSVRRLLALALVTATVSAQSLTPAPTQPGDVVAHLQLTVSWYDQVTAAGQNHEITGDLVSQIRLHQAAVDALQLGFDYARAQAALLRGTPTPSEESAARAPSNMEQLNTRLAARMASLQARLNDISTALARATLKSRAALLSQRDAITANLDLMRTIQGNVEQLRRFAATSQLGENAPDSLTAQIDALQRSVPEARHTASPSPTTTASSGRAANASTGTAPATSPAASGPRFEPESAGVVALATELLAMATARRQLANVLRTTDALDESIDKRRAPLGAGIRELARQSQMASAGTAPATTADLQAAVTRVKQLSTAVVPIGEQGIAVDNVRAALVEARNDLAARTGATARYLAIRTAVLLTAIAVVLFISDLWRRATFRYLQDPRRRQQFLLLRRIVVTGAIAVVLIVGFVSQIGSLATYAGFVTAGVAVALQNVILAVVAYFFLIGRYGVRVGDRITIGSVTGNVIEIGLVRIYLMEVTAPDWTPTGRIVVFSNAVLFQPAALFKQMPGVDYGWHVVTLTLAPGADLARAEHDIRAAVDSVYQEFREPIERQHARLQESVNFQTPVPQPDLQIRVADDGVAITVRYPAERTRATEMDNRMMTAIREAVAKAPGIPLSSAGAPKFAG